MAKFGDALRGYAHDTLKRDQYVCVYCGLDGKVWPNWLYFSWDHLLPKGHLERDNPEYIVAACISCNTFANRTVFAVDDVATGQPKTRAALIEQKRPVVLARRAEYQRYWVEHVRPQDASAPPILPVSLDA